PIRWRRRSAPGRHVLEGSKEHLLLTSITQTLEFWSTSKFASARSDCIAMARRRSRVIVLVFFVTVITVSIGAPLLGRECVRWREPTNGTQTGVPSFSSHCAGQILSSKTDRKLSIRLRFKLRCEADSARNVRAKYSTKCYVDFGKTSMC
ncbi:hypothetical protein MJO28_000777, partial [Puccinia striiformis f. sp. tritici]